MWYVCLSTHSDRISSMWDSRTAFWAVSLCMCSRVGKDDRLLITGHVTVTWVLSCEFMWLSCDLTWVLWPRVTCTNAGLPPCLYPYHCWLSRQPSGPWGEPLLCACSAYRSSSGRETSPQFAKQRRRWEESGWWARVKRVLCACAWT